MLPKGLLKEYASTFSMLLRGIDILAVVLSGVGAYYFKFHYTALPLYYINALLISALLTVLVFPVFHIYESMRGESFWMAMKKLMQAGITVLMLLALLSFITKTGDHFSREWFFDWVLFSLGALGLFRLSLLCVLRLMRSYGWNERRVIVVGSGVLTDKLVQTMQNALWTGFRIVMIWDVCEKLQQVTMSNVPIRKIPMDLGQYIDQEGGKIDEIWIALPLGAEERVTKILHQLRHHTLSIRYIFDVVNFSFFQHTINSLAGFPAVTLNVTPMVGMNRMIKAVEDRLLSCLILLLLSPLLLLLALAVKWSSAGPIFYRQRRISWNGKAFEMLKFRTMPVGAEAITGPVWAKSGEVRATKLGKWLRRTSLDELPQFINVLKGEMSIVGPRPERPIFVEQFKEQIPCYMQKHLVKAGITGWAQINGWRGNTSLEKRIEYDLYYIEHWSLWFDLKIIFFTLFRGFVHKNAY